MSTGHIPITHLMWGRAAGPSTMASCGVASQSTGREGGRWGSVHCTHGADLHCPTHEAFRIWQSQSMYLQYSHLSQYTPQAFGVRHKVNTSQALTESTHLRHSVSDTRYTHLRLSDTKNTPQTFSVRHKVHTSQAVRHKVSDTRYTPKAFSQTQGTHISGCQTQRTRLKSSVSDTMYIPQAFSVRHKVHTSGLQCQTHGTHREHTSQAVRHKVHTSGIQCQTQDTHQKLSVSKGAYYLSLSDTKYTPQAFSIRHKIHIKDLQCQTKVTCISGCQTQSTPHRHSVSNRKYIHVKHSQYKIHTSQIFGIRYSIHILGLKCKAQETKSQDFVGHKVCISGFQRQSSNTSKAFKVKQYTILTPEVSDKGYTSQAFSVCQWKRTHLSGVQSQSQGTKRETDRERQRQTAQKQTYIGGATDQLRGKQLWTKTMLLLSSSRVLVVRMATKVSLTVLDSGSMERRGRVDSTLSSLVRPISPVPDVPCSHWRWLMSSDLRFWSFSNVYNIHSDTEHVLTSSQNLQERPLWATILL